MTTFFFGGKRSRYDVILEPVILAVGRNSSAVSLCCYGAFCVLCTERNDGSTLGTICRRVICVLLSPVGILCCLVFGPE